MLSSLTDTEKTSYITQKLAERHLPTEEACFTELRIGGGFGRNSEQRLDFFAICYHPSKNNRTTVYEVKVSRSDFLSEIKKPLKRRRGLLYGNEFYFVMPRNIAKIEEIPPECGLIEVDDNGVFNVIIPAPFRDIPPLPRNFIGSILRRLDKERLMEYLKNVDENQWLQETGNALLEVLLDHIHKWTHYASGNKEIPDQIAQALRDVRYDLIQAMIKKKLIR